MTIITLNVWGGKIREPLLDFLRKHKDATDIFCFQEVFFRELFSDIEQILHEFDSRVFYAPENCLFEAKPLPEGVRVGLAIFVRKNIPIVRHGEYLTYQDLSVTDNNTGAFQFVELELQSYRVLVGNVHGLHWGGMGKQDNEARIQQSHMISGIIEEESLPTILCGDFNVAPNTESIAIFENSLHNVVVKNKIRSTRTSLYVKGEPHVSDYIFTSKHIEIDAFSVLQDVVSDHAPLRMEFSLPLQR